MVNLSEVTSLPTVAEEASRGRAWDPSVLSGPLTAVGAALAVGPLAASSGGFFSTSWGWAVVPLAWASGMALIVRPRVQVRRIEAVFLAGLTLLAAWTALSLLWTRDFPQTALELQRTVVYVSGGLAAVLLIRREFVPWAVVGLAAAGFAICAYSLATRLFPTGGRGSSIAENRLQGPIGYWNGLGIFTVLTVLLLIGLVARSPWRPLRSIAAAALVVSVSTLYFTFSRGAWAALIVAGLVLVAIDPRRLRLLLTVLVVAPFAAGAVAICARSTALTQLVGSLRQATADGHRAALVITLLAVGAGVSVAAFEWASGRVAPGPSAQRLYGLAWIAAAVAAVSVALVHYGGPVRAAQQAYDSFEGAPVQVGANTSLNTRLFNLSSNGRIDLWKTAWDDFVSHPALGSGAGSFEVWWYQHRTDNQTVQDAHSLYLETLAELGLPGLMLLALALGAPLAVIPRARRYRFAPFLAAAYVAFLVHAAVDWDWELSAVTLMAVLAGVLLLALARDRQGYLLRAPARTTIIALLLVPVAGFSLYTLIGNRKLSSASAALAAGDWRKGASEARSAAAWLPWSAAAWEMQAVADSNRGFRGRAAADMRQALDRSPNQWVFWYDLGTVTKGASQRAAYAKVRQLNPRESPTPRS